MITTSILNEKLKLFDYYKNKLPLYLQNSEGFQEHFRIWFDLLVGNDNKGLVGTADTLFNLMQIFDKDYLTYIETLDDYDEHTMDMLDKLGALFGVNRILQVTYTQDSSTITEQLNLTNAEFIYLIKSQIIRNYCEGTREQINGYYKDIGLEMYVQTTGIATANLYLVKNDNIPQNVIKLFLGGKLHIESMGITYEYLLIDFENLLLWDTRNWDEGEWAV